MENNTAFDQILNKVILEAISCISSAKSGENKEKRCVTINGTDLVVTAMCFGSSQLGQTADTKLYFKLTIASEKLLSKKKREQVKAALKILPFHMGLFVARNMGKGKGSDISCELTAAPFCAEQANLFSKGLKAYASQKPRLRAKKH